MMKDNDFGSGYSWKNREVVVEPMYYTFDLLTRNNQQEIELYGGINIPNVPPIVERDQITSVGDDYSRHDFGSEDELMDYLNWLDDNDEDEEVGWV